MAYVFLCKILCYMAHKSMYPYFSEGRGCMNNHSEYFLSVCFRTLLSSERDQFQSLSSSREKLLVYAQSTTTRQEKRT